MDSFTAFISRSLNSDSPLRRLTEAHPHLSWIDHSLIRFNQVLFNHIPKSDWIFFTSPRCVRYFFQCVKSNEIPLPEQVRYAAMGEGTKESLKNRGIASSFTGTGHPRETASNFLIRAEHQSVLFPRARRSKRSIQSALGDQIHSIDLVVYDNAMRTDVPLPRLQAAILTSPMNARSFVHNYDRRMPEWIFSWGSSTQAQLEALKVHQSKRLEHPSEEAAARALGRVLGD